MPDSFITITPDMTVLDIISRYRETERVFKKCDEIAGECICCHALFDSIGEMAEKYGIDLESLLAELKESAGSG